MKKMHNCGKNLLKKEHYNNNADNVIDNSIS